MINTSIHAYRKPFSMSMQTATVHNTIHWPVKIEQIQKYEDCKTKGLLIFLQIVWTRTHKPETFLLSSSIWSLVTEERCSKLHQVYRDTRLALQLTIVSKTGIEEDFIFSSACQSRRQWIITQSNNTSTYLVFMIQAEVHV